MELSKFFEVILLIVVIVFIGYKLLIGVRSSKKFNRELSNIQGSDKEAFIKNKGNLSNWELGSFTNLSKPLSFIGNMLALAVILFIVAMAITMILQ
jgi:hypothetical protein